jgi:hypothetical protein
MFRFYLRSSSLGLTTQGSGVRGRRARLSSTRKHARPRIPCSRLLGRVCGLSLSLLVQHGKCQIDFSFCAPNPIRDQPSRYSTVSYAFG